MRERVPQNVHVHVYNSSVESQKGVITIKRCSVENQKGAIAVQSLWQRNIFDLQ